MKETNPPDALESRMRDFIVSTYTAQAQGITRLDRHDDLQALSVFDSLTLFAFVSYLEQTLGIEIPGEDVTPDNFGSLAAVSAYLIENHGLE